MNPFLRPAALLVSVWVLLLSSPAGSAEGGELPERKTWTSREDFLFPQERGAGAPVETRRINVTIPPGPG